MDPSNDGTTPAEDANASEADAPPNVPTPFARQAARASCYLALAVYVLGGLSPLSMLMRGLLLVADLTAFGLGMIGIIGGAKDGATATIRMGALGAILSGIPLAMLAW